MEKVVIPGEFLGTIEEYVPGQNVIEVNGKIYASLYGILHFDDKHMTINIKPLTNLPIIRVGEVVYGVVSELYNDFALVTIVAIEGVEREIVGGKQDGIIHVSKISDRYVDEVGKMFRIGDIVRAKVIRSKPSIQLTTAEPALGVIKGLCMKCRSPMVKMDNYLFCERCNRKETRKISSLYGNIKIKVKNIP
ncbi:MAG: exosome complex RNA-binding protein Csl4 [Thermoplasmata archaeon]|nr:exosome complex RNA-binding protein Csl4 [Thermoplasmata archaeon]